jgi:T5SS/PEP-CTERM-associated repeat protein
LLIGGDAQDSIEIGDADATGATGQDFGTATVISGGTVSAVGNLVIGSDGGTGSLVVGSGGSVLANGQIGIGTGNTTYGAGFGLVTIGTGGTLAADVSGAVPTGSSGIYLGSYAGATGYLTVSGAGALATANGTRIIVGNLGNGTLNVSDGGTVLAGSTGSGYSAFRAGQSAGTVGLVTVSGSGAVISANGQAIIGQAGSGTLLVEAGGSFLAGSTNSALSTGFIVGETSGTGQVTVSGTGALLSATGGVRVGDGGTGNLTIAAGGTVIADTVAIGSDGAGGTLTLSPATSAAATLEVSGTLTIGTGGRVVGSGTIDPAVTTISGSYGAAGQLLGGTVIDDGTIEPASGTLVIGGPVDGTGAVRIDDGAAVVFDQAVDAGAGDALSLGFTGSAGVLDIKDLPAFDAVVSGYQSGDTIEIYGVTPPPAYSLSGGDTVLTFQGGETLTLAGDFAAGSVDVVNDPDPACYAAGTLIATPQGERPVEALCIGDPVLTASGQVRTVRWIGYRRYSGRFIAKNPGVRPIRIAAGALGDDLPRRDLVVSPKHAMLLDGVLVPAWVLVNGSSIVQLSEVTDIHYRHVELDSHDVILADGAPSETFVDDGSRGAFHNAHEYQPPAAGYQLAEPVYCAERVEHGEHLERIRSAIMQRAIDHVFGAAVQLSDQAGQASKASR